MLQLVTDEFREVDTNVHFVLLSSKVTPKAKEYDSTSFRFWYM